MIAHLSSVTMIAATTGTAITAAVAVIGSPLAIPLGLSAAAVMLVGGMSPHGLIALTARRH